MVSNVNFYLLEIKCLSIINQSIHPSINQSTNQSINHIVWRKLAAECTRVETSKVLIDEGVTCVLDSSGSSAPCVLIDRLPHLALEALNQLRTSNVITKTDSCYLQYLEASQQKVETKTTRTPLEIAVITQKSDSQQMDPVWKALHHLRFTINFMLFLEWHGQRLVWVRRKQAENCTFQLISKHGVSFLACFYYSWRHSTLPDIFTVGFASRIELCVKFIKLRLHTGPINCEFICRC